MDSIRGILTGLRERYSQVKEEPLKGHPFAEVFKSSVKEVWSCPDLVDT